MSTPSATSAVLLAFCIGVGAETATIDRGAPLRGSFGTYAGAPRSKDKRVNVDLLISELLELNANTYHWLIWHSPTDWDDLKRFLPPARQHNIRVWVCLVPPSESPPRAKNYSEPFRLDYERWATEIAKLSKTETNLVAWSIDDFCRNLAFFTPQYLGRVVATAREINPRLAFVPCVYFPRASQADLARNYRGMLDGILFPYRAESGKPNLTDPGRVEDEVGKIKGVWGKDFPVIVDVYCSPHSRLGDSTPQYVREVMSRAVRCGDGVHIYTHPRPGTEKHGIVRELFHQWSVKPPGRAAAMPKLTLPRKERPEWVRRDGVVMAGSWEPLMFRVRRDGAEGYTPTAEQRAAYEREQSEEMISKLKSLGVNFVMIHCYKGAGLRAERDSMADAVKFAELCRRHGLHVGCYTYSGAFLWELFFKEMPQAKDWVVLNPDGSPVTYGRASYRYYWNRNHPDAQEFYRNIVRFAVEEIRTDLVHFDNYHVGPGHDANSIVRFRDYLRRMFPASLLREHGITDVDSVLPPADRACTNLLGRAWADFCCQSLADSFHAMTRYARSLRPDILMEINPGGVGAVARWAVDHGRLLRGGEAFWDEGRHPGFAKGQLTTRIRTFKAARSTGNMAFVYTINPLEAAESMAFNLDCLGCICWFEYGELYEYPGRKTLMSQALLPYVRFFRQRRDLFRNAEVVADVGVFRSWPSMQFGPRDTARLTGLVEELLITNRCPFQLVFDQQLDELSRWPVLVLAGCMALSDAQVTAIRRYVANGGRLCVIGPLATHDEWMLTRPKPALDDLPADRVVRVDTRGDWLGAIRRACENKLSLAVGSNSPALCAELTGQPNRRMVHLVNYDPESPAMDVAVTVALPKGRTVTSVRLASPERNRDLPVEFIQQGDTAVFKVPGVGVYEIAVVDFQ
ncbi:MAG: hypothetical protein N3B01_01545 [Verrucomicrobiae bacterium]|nr:hypothetical protein [Verrucomicrobiae bacterium]